MSPAAGSSPLARGTPGPVHVLGPGGGLIPARAGNTVFGCLFKVCVGAHPRSRGEHSGLACIRSTNRGSSPLARGTPGGYRWLCAVLGLIPARAGNTSERGNSEADRGAHPRSRGEHRMTPPPEGATAGSSPLARGTLSGVEPIFEPLGLIPARAGNT